MTSCPWLLERVVVSCFVLWAEYNFRCHLVRIEDSEAGYWFELVESEDVVHHSFHNA
jgi:hypothetical protein